MPLQNNLRIIMAKQKIDSVSELMTITGLSRNALNKLWRDEDLESAKLGTLMIICDQLQIKLSDLIEYLPGEKQIIPEKQKKKPIN
ncbi:helix-turn-helix domain-containing protein [Bacillus sp. BRMEA1]|uniref:helix-turn-helix domain-containing protein n=1 Tax=Neobacillus endophyticus TaxID=2738405 RepID=UPI0015636BC0|nr:helix-turn-helix transcriptional regulator [Neobacillus endophyticus]NRD81137.1 helix-turn-helix domain-containing protein [Neobacillus endophyticus]